LVALFCGVRPGMTVVDACAGGGGKTIHLGALMENDGVIHAMDIDPDRMAPLVRRAGRAGLTIHSLGHRYAPDGSIVSAPEAADLVLLDVPCSGTGVLRRNPENRWRLSHERLETLRQTQQRLLDMWAPRVRPGGVLVYATCSLLEVENAMQVDAFLERHPEFTREAPEGFTGPVDAKGDLRTAPHTEGCDGFYAARLRRRG
jgi:16S rRNA (cytosine967-C5)-methyltransferase